MDIAEIKGTLGGRYEQPCGSRLGHLGEWTHFPRQKRQRFTTGDKGALRRREETRSVIETPPTGSPSVLTGQFYHIRKEALPPILQKFLQKLEEGILPNSRYGVSITLIPNPDTDITRKENYGPVHAKILDKTLAPNPTT